MKILLIHPHTYFTHYSDKRKAETLPIGFGIVNEIFLRNGCETIVLDIQGSNLPTSTVISFLDQQKENDIDVVAISAMSTQYAYVKWLVQKCREVLGNKLILLGGCLGHFNFEICLKYTGIDLIILGEAENTLPPLISTQFKDLTDIPSLAYRNVSNFIDKTSNKNYTTYQGLEIITHDIIEIDLNREENQIIPSYRNIDLRPYKSDIDGIRTSNLISARGCPYNCNFCSKQFRKFKLYPINYIDKQILVLKNSITDVRWITFIDEFVLINFERAKEISDLMKKYNFIWACNGRVNTFKSEIAEYIAKSGCVRITFGIESGSDQILTRMRKGQTAKMEKSAIQIAIDAGLNVNAQLIIGYPGENKKTLEETRKLFKNFDIRIAPIGFAFITPLPGSKLYDECIQNGLIKDEEVYLSSLEGGFNKVRINFTNWSNSELIRIKNRYTYAINDYLGHYSIPISIRIRESVMDLMKKILSFLGNQNHLKYKKIAINLLKKIKISKFIL